MRRISLWILSTISAVVLLFSYSTSTGQAATHVEAPVAAGGTPATGSSSGGTSSGTAPSRAISPTSAPSGGSSSGPETYTGATVDTQWGPVQVEITVTGGRITRARALQQPSGNARDEQINSQAIPTYSAEAVSAQSAQIDAVSGATVTWGGYTQSLQSAIDQAHLS